MVEQTKSRGGGKCAKAARNKPWCTAYLMRGQRNINKLLRAYRTLRRNPNDTTARTVVNKLEVQYGDAAKRQFRARSGVPLREDGWSRRDSASHTLRMWEKRRRREARRTHKDDRLLYAMPTTKRRGNDSFDELVQHFNAR